jgi:hypothetical protein
MIEKTEEKKRFLVAILKVTDENSRIQSQIRIRIRKSEVRIRGSGSVPKCRGSAKLGLKNFWKSYFLTFSSLFVFLLLNKTNASVQD